MLVRLVHSWKALDPMLVTLSGIVMLVIVLQDQKALSPMLVTGFPSMVSGMTSSPAKPSSQLVMVTSPLAVDHVRGISFGFLLSKIRPFQFSPFSPKELRATGLT